MAVDTVSKSPIVFEILLKKFFKLCPYHWVLSFGATFMLVPLLDHQSAEKQSGKKDSVEAIGSNSLEMVFALLAKAIAVEM